MFLLQHFFFKTEGITYKCYIFNLVKTRKFSQSKEILLLNLFLFLVVKHFCTSTSFIIHLYSNNSLLTDSLRQSAQRHIDW